VKSCVQWVSLVLFSFCTASASCCPTIVDFTVVLFLCSRSLFSTASCTITMASVYEEYALQEGEIRVVVLHSSTQADDPIECDLEIQLGSQGHYEALSYTWGTPYHEPEGHMAPEWRHEKYQCPDR
jgi:hypothetical protein